MLKMMIMYQHLGISSRISKNKVINYDDIPYAKPPVGDLRWKAPRELDISMNN